MARRQIDGLLRSCVPPSDEQQYRQPHSNVQTLNRQLDPRCYPAFQEANQPSRLHNLSVKSRPLALNQYYGLIDVAIIRSVTRQGILVPRGHGILVLYGLDLLSQPEAGRPNVA